ncbi:coiled-coil domain-containing protein 186-like isoform X1 [Schistocerca nitens]|uniref:coiled-coil domain-containing protein 186-like isoform X1 n=1 Tax=Schistocerca nitens TaxID=7011 RepID=UPI0021178798|nr:coiled-coil domain-containing protein 186-like isoform X1 [Schistocerca nitens]
MSHCREENNEYNEIMTLHANSENCKEQSDISGNSSPEMVALNWSNNSQHDQSETDNPNSTSNSSPEFITLASYEDQKNEELKADLSVNPSANITPLNSNNKCNVSDADSEKLERLSPSPESRHFFSTNVNAENNEMSQECDCVASPHIVYDNNNVCIQQESEQFSNDGVTAKVLVGKCLTGANGVNCDSSEGEKELPKRVDVAHSNVVTHLSETITNLKAEISRLESENQRLQADRSHEVYVVQLEALEKSILQYKTDLQRAEQISKQQAVQAEATAKQQSSVIRDLQEKLDKMTKMWEASKRETEAAVVRYAVSEKELMDQRKEREAADRRLKDAVKEREALSAKLRTAAAEKTRVCQMLDAKCHELTSMQKETERFKDDLNNRDIKIKWLQNKLRSETETHKETQAKVDKLTRSLAEAKEECEQVRKDCQEMIRAYQQSEKNRAVVLDQQLKEEQAKLILERYEREDKEEVSKHLQQELEALKAKHETMIAENNTLSIKVQNLEKERFEREQTLSRLRQAADSQQQDVADLRAQVAEMSALRMQLNHEQERLSASQEEVERLRQTNQELQQDTTACREREAELLDFTQRLTDKNVRLQSEFSATEAKARELELEAARLARQNSELQQRLSASAADLESERSARQNEAELLARALAERTAYTQKLEQQCSDLRGEQEIAARKHAAAVKELNRELQHLRRKYERCESPGLLGSHSRTSSCSSLPGSGCEINVNGQATASTAIQVTPPAADESSAVSVAVRGPSNAPSEPDRQALVERIVRLQRSVARKTEKLEFLEEHTKQLVAELQRKSRLVQNYVLREQTGALAPEASDNNKMEIAKHGGIMASLYSSKPADSHMTLELSLEINRKLQAVLEDTLLKNITLKENIDTLGREIARLTSQKNAVSTS